MSQVNQREEFIFLYDVTNANPNGDPLDENKPRIDEESGLNIVTDVRLKRTIRDYLFNYKGHNGENGRDIFVRQIEGKGGKGLQDGIARVGNFGNDAAKILQSCIDIRLFGGVLPMKGDSFRYTGPVQFKMGRSLHRVTLTHIQGTGAFASKEGREQNTFREEYILPYSLICFYGVVNENAARHTGLTQADVEEMFEALWEGTKNLISRSKMGHMPRLLLRLRHQAPNFFIGDLDHRVRLAPKDPKTPDEEVVDESLRRIDDFKVDLSALQAVLDAHRDKVGQIDLKTDDRVEVTGWTG